MALKLVHTTETDKVTSFTATYADTIYSWYKSSGQCDLSRMATVIPSIKLFYQYEKYGGVERSKKERSVPRASSSTVFAVPPYLLTKRNLQVSANLFWSQTKTFSETSSLKTGCRCRRGNASLRTNCEVSVRIQFAEMRSHEVVN